MLKIFDVFHPLTASLLYLAALCFDGVALIKPNQSRPANSERYVICRGYKFGASNVWNGATRTVAEPHFTVKHLLDINMTMNRQNEEKEAVDALRRRLESLESAEDEAKTQSDHSELRKEIAAKEALLKEVCPLIPVQGMAPSFVKWLKTFNETNARRQVCHFIFW